MLKLSDSHEYEDGSFRLIDPSRLEKRASHSAIESYLAGLSTSPDKIYLHINAMGAGETYGANRNGDYFPEANLKAYFKTFETGAKLFRHHANKAHNPSYGKVLLAVYNDSLHRVELIVEADRELVQDVEKKIAQGEFPKTSMATRTPYDECSICGNRATSRQAYCSHLRNELGKIYSDGRKVMAMNTGPLSFIDISLVTVPADPTSSVLRKVAGEGNFEPVLGSVEQAEITGLDALHKTAEFKKLSELVKEFTGDITSAHRGLAAQAQDLPIHLAKKLAGFELSEVFGTMAKLGLSPSVAFLAELIAIKHLGLRFEGIGRLVEDFLSKLHGQTNVPVVHFEAKESPQVESLLNNHVKSSSFLPSHVEERAARGYQTTGVGYFGQGPYITPTYEEHLVMARKVEGGIVESPLEQALDKYGKLIINLGGAALFAKLFIASEIEKHHIQKGAKIVLVKQASDYQLAADLSRASYRPSPVNEQDSNANYSGVGVQKFTTKLSKQMLKDANPSFYHKIKGLLRLGSIAQHIG